MPHNYNTGVQHSLFLSLSSVQWTISLVAISLRIPFLSVAIRVDSTLLLTCRYRQLRCPRRRYRGQRFRHVVRLLITALPTHQAPFAVRRRRSLDEIHYQ